MSQAPPRDVDDYIAGFPPRVQAILQKIRQTIRRAVPAAREKISYRMPTFAVDRNLVYFAAFKHHIGLYPPVRGDAKLMRDVARYAGEKGNLKFPLDEPVPYALIARIVKSHVEQAAERSRVAGKKS